MTTVTIHRQLARHHVAVMEEPASDPAPGGVESGAVARARLVKRALATPDWAHFRLSVVCALIESDWVKQSPTARRKRDRNRRTSGLGVRLKLHVTYDQ